MRQVPTYLIIGSGRVARHASHYLSILNIKYNQWDRSLPVEQLSALTAAATHILLLISDDAIEPFIASHLKDASGLLIHFSGSLVTPQAFGAHPLMTFGQTLYSEADYRAIPFVIDANAPVFEDLLPGMPNSHVRLSPEQKAKYHALCVLSGNFSCMLWQKLMADFENELQLPAAIAYPYLQRQMQNLMSDYQTALTGPLPRHDQLTIQKNIQALDGDPFQTIYHAFVDAYRKNEVCDENS